MKLRIGITILAICIYVALFNVYIFQILNWSPYAGKVFYTLLTSGAISFALIDLKAGFVNTYHKQFNLLLFLCVLANYGLILAKLFELINPMNPQPMFYAFNGSVLFVTITIFFNELKYKVMGDPD